MNFLHYYQPKPILLNFGPVAIHWYGVMIILGIIAGIFVTIKLAEKYGIKKDEVIDLVFWLVIFSVIGGRIYAVLLFWNYYWRNPFEIIKVWHGGLAIHGVIFGGLITLIIYCQKKKQSFWQWADLIAPALALGQAFGRWGNYFNQELFGKPTDLPWGIPIEIDYRPSEFLQFEYFHPTFLYESFLNLAIFIILIFLHFNFFKKRYHSKHAKDSQYVSANIFLIYLILYSLVRISMEFLRLDETPLILGIRLPIVISVLIILASIIIIFFIQIKKRVKGGELSLSIKNK